MTDPGRRAILAVGETALAPASRLAERTLADRRQREEMAVAGSAVVEGFVRAVARITVEEWRTVIGEWIWVATHPPFSTAWNGSMELAALRATQLGRDSQARQAAMAARAAAREGIVAAANLTGSESYFPGSALSWGDVSSDFLAKDTIQMIGSIGALVVVSHDLPAYAIEAAFWPIQAVIPSTAVPQGYERSRFAG